MSQTAQPNPVTVAWSVLRAMRVGRPDPKGYGRVSHASLTPILAAIESHGTSCLPEWINELDAYRDDLSAVDPDQLDAAGALAYWMNLYNAGALRRAAEAVASDAPSVLKVGRPFSRTWVTVADEHLSLDDIEHGKIRRFRDPRVHGGLVCGSASCPTVRYEPFSGERIDAQLEDQMARFLADGGAVAVKSSNALLLSRIFLWYGGDFTRPRRMPTLLPARKEAVAAAISRWLPAEVKEWRAASGADIQFQPYDWALSCRIS